MNSEMVCVPHELIVSTGRRRHAPNLRRRTARFMQRWIDDEARYWPAYMQRPAHFAKLSALALDQNGIEKNATFVRLAEDDMRTLTIMLVLANNARWPMLPPPRTLALPAPRQTIKQEQAMSEPDNPEVMGPLSN